ncbi:phosphoribosylformylglycinamidine synthase, partial [Patescibacteria group bacterium]|nr:phosphoribosylformylglycinamidine synthase [Patescibacteria group bacterium]
NNRYQGKPLVFVGTVGLIPKKTNGNKLFEKKALSGDYIVMVGGRVGQDGIHGATFSSEAMDSKSPATAVQIGDPITQKKLSDAIVKEARDRNLYSSITDNGAGGISCSVAEMAKESGGCTVNLDKVPLKYPGLELWQTWISESQERMTLSIPKNKWKEFKKLMDKRGVEATIIGEFNSSSRCIVKQNKNTIMDIDMKFLHDGLPKREMKTKKPNLNLRETEIRKPKNQNITFLKMLSRLNIAGFEFISSQYDYEVQGNSVLKPLQGKGKVNSETSAVKPLFDSKKGVLLSQGLFPNLSEINSYSMAGASIDLAIRNIVAAGGDINKIALLDNFCWCSPNNPERLYQLREAARGCFDFAVAYEAPFISGKDSMFNDFKGYNKNGKSVKISVPPTLLISSIGIVDDVTSLVSLDFKFADDYIYVLGETNNELAGSEYLELLKVKDLSTPKLDPIKNRKMYIVFAKAIKKNLISSSIAISRGGIGTALAKSTMAGFLGVDVSLKNLKGTAIRDDFALYSESLGRILISVAPKNKKVFERIMKNYSVSLIGKVTEKKEIRIRGINEKTIINILTKKALNKYKGRFKKY